jgi:hypothetical protein
VLQGLWTVNLQVMDVRSMNIIIQARKRHFTQLVINLTAQGKVEPTSFKMLSNLMHHAHANAIAKKGQQLSRKTPLRISVLRLPSA